LSQAYFTADSRVLDAEVPRRLMLMTCAPLSAAQMMPLATQLYWPLPLSPRTLTFIKLVVNPTPATPRPLSVTAAALPATWVPCP